MRRYVHSLRQNTSIGQTDGRTDGMICPNNIALCMHRMLTRDNKLQTVQFHHPIMHSETRDL